MNKYLGIDFGDKYIGLALATGQERLALPLQVVSYDVNFWPVLTAIVKEEAVTQIVVGWPLSLSGGENERTRATARFVERLKQYIGVPVSFADERLTSAASGQKRGERNDHRAAAHILQNYLDRHEQSES